MDENGIGLNETYSSSEDTWWRHVCDCGHNWDSMLQIDTCWLCGEVSLSTMDRDTAYAKGQLLKIKDIPENLMEDIV